MYMYIYIFILISFIVILVIYISYSSPPVLELIEREPYDGGKNPLIAERRGLKVC